MKKTLTLTATVLIIILAAGILKDQVIKSVITVVATQVTGAPVHIDGLSLGLFSQRVRISGFKMYNPKGFSRGILVDLPKINVAYDLGGLFNKKIHLSSAEIELREMGIEKNKENQLNVDELKVTKQGEKQAAKPAGRMPMRIDTLKLKIGRIVSKDYSSGKEPVVKVYDVNIDTGYKNITSPEQLAALILSEPMKAAGIAGAKIYGVAMLAGVAVLPVGIVATFAARDSVQKEFSANFDSAYRVILETLKRKGRVTQEDKAGGIIAAEIGSAQVNVKITKKVNNRTEVIISAREFLFPKPEIANGVLYEISKKLK